MRIVSSPKLRESHTSLLEMLITDLIQLFKKLTGKLPSKFHIFTHYLNMIRKNGPPILYSYMRFESKHRQIKKILLNTSSHRNILKTIAIKM